LNQPFLTPEQKVRRCIERHPDWTTARIAKSTGIRIAEVEALRGGQATPQGEPQPGTGGNGLIALSSIVARYDVRSAILREIGELPSDKVISEADLCQRTSGSDRNRFRRTVENCAAEFEPYRIRIKLDKDRDPVYVWGCASAIEALKKAVNPWA